jgi:hypothetical protein
MNHRVTPVIYTRYAVPPLEVDIASGRVEDSRSFSQKNSQSEFFCEKDKKSTMLPQASQVPSDQKPGLNTHRVTRVIDRSYAVGIWTTNTTK